MDTWLADLGLKTPMLTVYSDLRVIGLRAMECSVLASTSVPKGAANQCSLFLVLIKQIPRVVWMTIIQS